MQSFRETKILYNLSYSIFHQGIKMTYNVSIPNCVLIIYVRPWFDTSYTDNDPPYWRNN